MIVTLQPSISLNPGNSISNLKGATPQTVLLHGKAGQIGKGIRCWFPSYPTKKVAVQKLIWREYRQGERCEVFWIARN